MLNEDRPLTMMEDLIDDYTILFGTQGDDAIKHLVKDMLAFMSGHRSYTSDELYVALKTKPVTPPTLMGLPVRVVDSIPGKAGDIVFGPPLYTK